MASKNYGQRLIPEPDLKYLEKVIETYPDPTDIGGGGGTSYSAGDGIIIADDTISVDQEDVAMVANLANVAFSGSYSDLTNTPTIPQGLELTMDQTTGTQFPLTPEQYAKIALGTVVTVHDNYHIQHSTFGFTISELDNDGYYYGYQNIVSSSYANNQEFDLMQAYISIKDDGFFNFEISQNPLFKVGSGLTVDDSLYPVTIKVDTSILPAAVSGVNDGTNWTSLTIGNDTYSIGSSTPSNMVTTNTTQAITGTKTFINSNGIQSRSSWTSSNRAILNGYSTTPYLELQTGNGYTDNLMISSHQISYTPANGSSIKDFKIIAHYPEDSNKAFTYTFKAPLYTDTAKTFTVATTDDITAISGTNDGTNWTSLTIGSDTYNIGGGSSQTYTHVINFETADQPSGSRSIGGTLTIVSSSATQFTWATMFDYMQTLGTGIKYPMSGRYYYSGNNYAAYDVMYTTSSGGCLIFSIIGTSYSDTSWNRSFTPYSFTDTVITN